VNDYINVHRNSPTPPLRKSAKGCPQIQPNLTIITEVKEDSQAQNMSSTNQSPADMRANGNISVFVTRSGRNILEVVIPADDETTQVRVVAGNTVECRIQGNGAHINLTVPQNVTDANRSLPPGTPTAVQVSGIDSNGIPQLPGGFPLRTDAGEDDLPYPGWEDYSEEESEAVGHVSEIQESVRGDREGASSSAEQQNADRNSISTGSHNIIDLTEDGSDTDTPPQENEAATNLIVDDSEADTEQGNSEDIDRTHTASEASGSEDDLPLALVRRGTEEQVGNENGGAVAIRPHHTRRLNGQTFETWTFEEEKIVCMIWHVGMPWAYAAQQQVLPGRSAWGMRAKLNRLRQTGRLDQDENGIWWLHRRRPRRNAARPDIEAAGT
jgi:hypothetical protein